MAEPPQPQRVLAAVRLLAAAQDPEAIRAAEAALAREGAAPGFGVALAQIAHAAELPPPDRQAAAVLLKQYVKQHWVEGERGFVPPEVSEADKAAIRAALPAGLADPDSKIRTAVGMAIAAVAAWDWPQAWPGLLEFIVGAIKERKDTNLLMGCLRCLGVMASDLDNDQAPALVQALSPELAAVVSAPHTPPGLAATCFAIMAELAGALASLSGTYQRQVRNMLVPLMSPWVPLVCGVLGADMQDRAGWPAKHAALRLAQPLVTYFSKPLEGSVPALMGATWQLLLAAQPLHQAVLVEGSGEDGHDAADGADGDEGVGLESLLAQLFELLLSLVGPPRFRQQLGAALPQLVYVAIPYLQMTEAVRVPAGAQDQAHAWAASVNQFVADEEEDIVSCRASAELVLVELADTFGVAALVLLLEAVSRRLAEADAAAAAGQASWWAMREAAIMALGACSDQLVQAVASGALPAAQLQQAVDALLQRDLAPLAATGAALQAQQQPVPPPQLGDDGQQLLAGRALCVGARLQEVATPAQREALLQAAAAAVVAGSSATVSIGAFRALACLCPAAPAAGLAALLPQLLPALVRLLGAAEEESLHLVLEVLAAVIDAAGARGAPGLAPEQALAVAQPVLQVWVAHTADPLIAPDAQAVIAAIAAHPACLPGLAAAAAPTLAGILARGAAARGAARAAAPPPAAQGAGEEGPMLVEASLDLLGTLVDPGQPAVAAELCRGVLGPVLALLSASDDPSELNSAVQLLLQLLRCCPTPELLAACAADAPGEGGGPLARLLGAALQLVAPAQPDSCSRCAGPLLAQLLKTFPSELAAPPPPALAAGAGAAAGPAAGSCVGLLLHALAAKLAGGGCSAATVASLLEFVVCLALLDSARLLELLAGMQLASPGGSAASGLAVVVPLWLEHAPDMTGSLLTRRSAAALLQLLQARHHPALVGLLCQGQPVEEAGGGGGGRVTRARARQQGGLHYTQVPAPAKVLQVLGQLLAADAEGGRGGGGGEEEEGDWGDESGSDDDDDGGGACAPDFSSPVGARLKAMGVPPELGGEGGLDLADVMDRSAAATPLPDDPADANDPLLRTPMRALVRAGLAQLAAADPGWFEAAAPHLGARERAALEAALGVSAAPGQRRRALLDAGPAEWMPAVGAAAAPQAAPPSGAAAVSVWLAGIAGPTARITAPRAGQELVITGKQPVMFDGAASQALAGAALVGWDWEVSGTRDDGRPFETSFVGAQRSVVLPAGRYAATLTVAAAQHGDGVLSSGSDVVQAFTVRNATAEAEAAAAAGSGAAAPPFAAPEAPQQLLEGPPEPGQQLDEAGQQQAALPPPTQLDIAPLATMAAMAPLPGAAAAADQAPDAAGSDAELLGGTAAAAAAPLPPAGPAVSEAAEQQQQPAPPAAAPAAPPAWPVDMAGIAPGQIFGWAFESVLTTAGSEWEAAQAAAAAEEARRQAELAALMQVRGAGGGARG
ncbi:Ipo9 [Scenedesmus sp. PABB004]|nr:Ipo9 [Scenedesmus sp. PABB004]